MTTASPQRTLWLALGGIVAVLATVWTGFVLSGWTIGSVTRDGHQTLPITSTSLTIDTSSTDVTLVPTSGPPAIDTHAKGTLSVPKIRTQVVGNEVKVHGGCHIVVFGNCSAKVTVHVPDRMAVSVSTGSGDVRASDLRAPLRVSVRSGDIDLDTIGDDVAVHVTSGDIDARRIAGVTELRATSGDISATEMTAPSIIAHATSGDVLVDAATAPKQLDASATSGDVEVTVPRGVRYDGSVETSSGDRSMSIASDPAAAHKIRVEATSGDADLRYR
jgi:hypothetical protein